MKRLTVLLLLLAMLLIACEKDSTDADDSAESAASTSRSTFALTTTADRVLPTDTLPDIIPGDTPQAESEI